MHPTLIECSRHSPSSICTLHTSHSIFLTCTLPFPWAVTKTSGQSKVILLQAAVETLLCQHCSSACHPPHRFWWAQSHQWKSCREASRRRWAALCSDRRSGRPGVRPARPPARGRRRAPRRRLGRPPGRSAGPAGGWRCCSVLPAARAPRRRGPRAAPTAARAARGLRARRSGGAHVEGTQGWWWVSWCCRPWRIPGERDPHSRADRKSFGTSVPPSRKTSSNVFYYTVTYCNIIISSIHLHTLSLCQKHRGTGVSKSVSPHRFCDRGVLSE